MKQDPTKAKGFHVKIGNESAFLYFNTKKPYWKKKPLAYLGSNWDHFYDLLEFSTCDLTKFFIKFESEEELKPLLEHCQYWS